MTNFKQLDIIKAFDRYLKMVASIKEIITFHLPWSVISRKNCFYGTQYQNQNDKPIKLTSICFALSLVYLNKYSYNR